MGRSTLLKNMETTEIFALYKPGDGEADRLVVRLDGPHTTGGNWQYIPVECFETGERFDPRIDLLHLMTEMEVLAWASR